jgi:archaellum biogenesis ATPase FlaH
MICKGLEDKSPRTVGCYRGDKTNPKDWSDFVQAYMIALEKRWHIGFCLSANDPYTVVDMDNKTNDSEYAKQIDATCGILKNTFIEYSISGLGRHAWLKGNIESGRKKAPFEFFAENAFIIMTGDIMSAAPITDEYQWWLDNAIQWCGLAHERGYIPVDWTAEATPEELEIDQLCLDTMSRFSNATNIEYWFYGQDFADPSNNQHSENDLALMQAFYKFNNGRPQRDVATVRMFLRSPRAHPELLQKRKSNWRQYVARTLNAARSRVDKEELPMYPISGLSAAVGQFPGSGSNIYQFPRGEKIGADAMPIGAASGQKPQPRIWTPPQPQLPHYVSYSEETILQRPDIDWVLKYVITRGELAVMWGEPKSGKSFLAMDLAYAVSMGNSWFGFKTTQMPVIYLMLEGSKGLKQRIEARRKYWGITQYNQNLEFIDHNFDLVDDYQHMVRHLNQNGKFNGLIVIDTLSRATPTMDENQSSDMGRIIAAAEMLEQETESTALMVHHSTKDKDHPTMRGHSRLLGAVSTIEVQRGEKLGEGVWRPGEIKESGTRSDHRFKLEPVPLGTDRDGDMMGSCVIVPLPPFDGDDEPMKGAKSRRQYNKMSGSTESTGSAGRPKWTSPQQQRMIREVEKLAWNADVRKGYRAVEYWKITQAIGRFLPDGATSREQRDLLRAFNKMVSEGCFECEKVGDVDWLWKVKN